MRRILLVVIGLTVALCLLGLDPEARADDGVSVQPLPVMPGMQGGNNFGGEPGLQHSGPDLNPGALGGLFLCPGVGLAVSVLGGGGGYCDYNFLPVEVKPGVWGNTHVHCEWGGFNPIVNTWQCWRVFPGQPDHPRLPDPDIIPDGMGVPWAIQGPTPQNQWPPIDLVPGQDLLNGGDGNAEVPEPVPVP